MTTPESDYLFRLATLSLSFVGFSAVVVTLRGALKGELADRHLRLVRLYIEGGLLVTALAVLPTLLNLLHIPDTVTGRCPARPLLRSLPSFSSVQFRRRRMVEPADFPHGSSSFTPCQSSRLRICGSTRQEAPSHRVPALTPLS